VETGEGIKIPHLFSVLQTVNGLQLATKIKLRSAHLDNKRYQRHIKSNHSKAAAVETVANEWVK